MLCAWPSASARSGAGRGRSKPCALSPIASTALLPVTPFPRAGPWVLMTDICASAARPQRHFNRHVFELELAAYAKEGLQQWVRLVTYADNTPILNLVEVSRPRGWCRSVPPACCDDETQRGRCDARNPTESQLTCAARPTHSGVRRHSVADRRRAVAAQRHRQVAGRQAPPAPWRARQLPQAALRRAGEFNTCTRLIGHKGIRVFAMRAPATAPVSLAASPAPGATPAERRPYTSALAVPHRSSALSTTRVR
jgi:hypothetical protein